MGAVVAAEMTKILTFTDCGNRRLHVVAGFWAERMRVKDPGEEGVVYALRIDQVSASGLFFRFNPAFQERLIGSLE
jgi:hypothetical protein